MKCVAFFLAAGFFLVGVLVSFEGAFALLFGWISFLARTVPRIGVDWPAVAVFGTALFLFTAGAHWVGQGWRRRVAEGQGEVVRGWKFRWTLAAVAVVFLLFAVGIFLVGITHQVSWLLTADEPLDGLALKSDYHFSHERLRGIGIGVSSYRSNYQAFPPGGTFKPDGTMLHSWETHLLPFLLYSSQGIDMKRPWNHPRNQKYFKCVIPEFINPEFRPPALEDAEGYGLSHYAANSRVMAGNKALKRELADGASYLLVIGEVNAGFKPWGSPVNWRDPAVGINQSPNGFGGNRGSGGANFVMADGSVRFVSDRISPGVLRALSSPADGRKIDPEVLEDPR
jgi:prepilin-type processing-associated H-X9-DG protein